MNRRPSVVVGLAGLLAATDPRVAHTQRAPADPRAPHPAGSPYPSPYPVRALDRPATLPRGDARLDAFAFATSVPGSPTSVTLVLGGGVGLSKRFEMGGQVVPFEIEPGGAFTNPSIYATYAFPIGAAIDVAPTIQVVYPLKAEDPFIIDLGGTLDADIGTWGSLALAPTLSLNARRDESGSSLSLPLTIQRQASERLTVQVTTGVGLSRFDPRFGVSRRRDALDFNDVTIPAATMITYTMARGSPRRPLADLALQLQWPQLYTRARGVRGTHTDDWAVQLQSSWYFIH